MQDYNRFWILFVIQDKEGENISFHDSWQQATENVKDNEVIKLEIYDKLKKVCEYINLP